MFKAFANPVHLMTINNQLYISGYNNVWLTDKYLNVIQQYNSVNTSLAGICFNSTNNTIYVADSDNYIITMLSLNLTLVGSFSTYSYLPWELQIYNNQLYVGTSTGVILVMVNQIIQNIISTCSFGWVEGIQFDQYGLMAASCYNINTTKILFANGSDTNNNYAVENPTFTSFDSKGRIVLLLEYLIQIYH